MSTVAWKDAPTRTVDVGGVEFVHLVLDSLGATTSRELTWRPAARRQSHRYLRATRPRVRARDRREPDAAARDDSPQPPHPPQDPPAGRELRVPLHARQRRPAREDRRAGRRRPNRPAIGRIVPFDQTPEALAALSKGGVRGKVVISYR